MFGDLARGYAVGLIFGHHLGGLMKEVRKYRLGGGGA